MQILCIPTSLEKRKLCNARLTRLDSDKNGLSKQHRGVSNQIKGEYNYLAEVKGRRQKTKTKGKASKKISKKVEDEKKI